MDTKNNIAIYKPEGSALFEVQVDNETVWLNRKDISALFGRDIKTIGKHIGNVFSEGELDKDSTVAKYATVQREGERDVTREIEHYNLDVVISVGYRVKSHNGTQFRIWANKVLKDYLTKGYSINEKKLERATQQIEEFKRVVAITDKIITNHSLETDETKGLVRILSSYTTALDLLDDYDYQRLEIPDSNNREVVRISYTDARKAIDELGKNSEFEGLFGKEKDDSFKGSLENIYQTIAGEDVYPSIEEKAANLLYFVTKNHSFTDGNKRIAAFLFVWFLDLNNALSDDNFQKRIPEKTLVALTLMIAESNSRDKDTMIKVVVNLL